MRIAKTLLLGAALVALAGCGSHLATEERRALGLGHLDAATGLPDPDPVKAVEAAFSRGELQVASALANRALRADPFDAGLHTVNGRIYEALAARGAPQFQGLAETAYRVAVQLDPADRTAAAGLARRLMARRDYESALVAYALLLNQHAEPGVYAQLATAAYFAGRPSIAAWAAGEAARSGRNGVVDLIAEAAAAALGTGAGGAGASRPELEGLVRRWSALRADPKGVPATATPPADVSASDPSGPSADATGAPGGGAVIRRWDSCDQAPPSSGGGFSSGGMGDGTTGQIFGTITSLESAPLEALPAPCDGVALPRMAFIDVTMIASEDIALDRTGLNLLDQLQVVLNGSIESRTQRAGGPAQTQTTIVGSVALPQSGITYSLNVANATGAVSEVVASPTLVALDRRPSTFFSGESLLAGVSGNFSGNLYQIPAGVSLSVTPTFLDDERLLLAVKVLRSAFQENVVGLFPASVQTSRNEVSANVSLRIGETLILSGIIETQKSSEFSQVPVLGDLPVANLATRERIGEARKTSVLVLLTPRRADTAASPETTAPVFAPDERDAYISLLERRATAAGFDPAADRRLTAGLTAADRAVVYPPALLRRADAEGGDLLPR